MNKDRFLFALVLGGALAVSSLNGCQTGSSVQNVSVKWEQNYDTLSQLRFFKASGRVAIITARERKGAAYDIDGFGSGFVFNINAPLGPSIARVTVTDNRLSLAMDGKTYEDDTARAVFEKAFGIDVPVDRIKRIFLGIPQGDLKRDSEGRITGAMWDGFDIGYEGSVTTDGITIPQIITVVHGPYTLKLSVIEFNPGKSSK